MTGARLGLLKTTFVDYPGLVASTVFTHGCNLRCPFCHNPELVTGPVPDDFLSCDEVLRFLTRRRSVLAGVCITGGEPLIHSWLPEFAHAVHALDLKVKLDTNGLLPERIEQVGADYIAMDIKTAPERYKMLGGGIPDPAARLRESVKVVRSTAPEYEFRTTVLDPVVSEEDIRAIVSLLEPGERYTLAAFRSGKTLDPEYRNKPEPPLTLLRRYRDIARERGLDVRIRDNRIAGEAAL
jgi:pyruvate formate lyase activating enzyme